MNNFDISSSELKFSGVIDGDKPKPYDPIEQALIEGLASAHSRVNHESEEETNFEQALHKQESETLSPESDPFYPSPRNASLSNQEQEEERSTATLEVPPDQPQTLPSANSSVRQQTEQSRAEVVNNATTLQFQTYAMKAQHQYIQNLTKANLSMKAKISHLEDQLGRANEEQHMIEQISSANLQPLPAESSMTNYERSEDQMEEMNLYSVGRLGDPRKESRDDQPWNNSARRSQKNDYGGNRGQNNGRFDDSQRQGNSRPFANQPSEQNHFDPHAQRTAGGRGSRNDYPGSKAFQPTERGEMNQGRGGRGYRGKPTSNWPSEKFEDSGQNSNSNGGFNQKRFEYRGGLQDGSMSAGQHHQANGRGRGRGRGGTPRNTNQQTNGFDNDGKPGWASHRQVTYCGEDQQRNSNPEPCADNDQEQGSNFNSRGGFNQGSSNYRQGGRGRGGPGNYNRQEGRPDKENVDQSNFNSRPADSGSGRGRGSGRLPFQKDQRENKPYGYNRQNYNSNSKFEGHQPKTSFGEPPIKNMGRGRGGNRSQQQNTNRPWSNNHGQDEWTREYSENHPVPEQEEARECPEQFQCSGQPDAFSAEDQKSGGFRVERLNAGANQQEEDANVQGVYEEGEFLITAPACPFQPRHRFIDGNPTGEEQNESNGRNSERDHGQAQVIELSEETLDEIPQAAHVAHAEWKEVKQDGAEEDKPAFSAAEGDAHEEEPVDLDISHDNSRLDPWEAAAVDPKEDQEYGEEDFADAQDYEALREDIRTAREECDEVKLSVAIDLAKELGASYPYPAELDDAEDHLYELMQCPAVPPQAESATSSDLQLVEPSPRTTTEITPATDETTHAS